MAEYYLSYHDMYYFVENNINKNDDNVVGYKAEILTAFTGSFEGKNTCDISQMVALWDNQILQPSELLLGTRYIRVSEAAICFIEVALASGLLDGLIQFILGQPLKLEISIGSAIVLSVKNLLSSVCSLDDWDFCVYLQAVTHFRKHKKFSKNDLISWFPEFSTQCNMHTSKWECSHRDENDKCKINESKQIDDALSSLELKGIIKKNFEQNNYTFQFNK